MRDLSSKFRRFVRKDAVLFATVPFMVLLNVLSNTITQGIFGFTFPWSLIPIGGILIAVVDDAAKIFVAEATPSRDSRPSSDEATTATDAYLAQVRRYRQDMDQMARTSRGERLKDVATQFDEWADAVERMAGRIDNFQKNAAIQHDLRTVPQSINKLEAQLAMEENERVRTQLKSTLAMRRNQLASLEHLQQTIRAAEIQLESTVASLGTIHSQVLASQSTNQIADYGHLAAEAQEQTRALNDYLETLEEVKLGRTASTLS